MPQLKILHSATKSWHGLLRCLLPRTLGLWMYAGLWAFGPPAAPDLALAAGAACLGLCAGSCVVCLADPTRGATSSLWVTQGWWGEAAWVFYPLRSLLQAPRGGWDDPRPVGSVPRVRCSSPGVVGHSRLRWGWGVEGDCRWGLKRVPLVTVLTVPSPALHLGSTDRGRALLGRA